MTTILLVEDTLDLAKVIRRELEAEGYELLMAVDGLQALELYAKHQPDIIILDWLLPGMDGLSVLRKIRSKSATPVMMLTACGDEIDRVLGLEVGADDYLTIANGNDGGSGGGIYNSSTIVTIANSTFSGNSAAYGGGLVNTAIGTITEIANSTFSGNSATSHKAAASITVAQSPRSPTPSLPIAPQA